MDEYFPGSTPDGVLPDSTSGEENFAEVDGPDHTMELDNDGDVPDGVSPAAGEVEYRVSSCY